MAYRQYTLPSQYSAPNAKKTYRKIIECEMCIRVYVYVFCTFVYMFICAGYKTWLYKLCNVVYRESSSFLRISCISLTHVFEAVKGSGSYTVNLLALVFSVFEPLFRKPMNCVEVEFQTRHRQSRVFRY